jgi:hypothetical protein
MGQSDPGGQHQGGMTFHKSGSANPCTRSKQTISNPIYQRHLPAIARLSDFE